MSLTSSSPSLPSITTLSINIPFSVAGGWSACSIIIDARANLITTHVIASHPSLARPFLPSVLGCSMRLAHSCRKVALP
ncbi:hypothetical protein E2C01_052499 [Portunus trituberculatus]|uniref:Uncharacterized protein n=1 Tax=Portunus trituberculatus TaxID=210409 RepID=A0A5B7GHU3_PORTR|nr:hypothetical protein [Portunus trituberculatus]